MGFRTDLWPRTTSALCVGLKMTQLPRRKQTDLKAETGQANAGQRRPRSGWRAKANIASLWLPKAYDPSTECGIAGDDVVELCFERDGVLDGARRYRQHVLEVSLPVEFL